VDQKRLGEKGLRRSKNGGKEKEEMREKGEVVGSERITWCPHYTLPFRDRGQKRGRQRRKNGR